MSTTSILPGRRATAVLLVAAAVLELAETLVSPLQGGSTASEMTLVAAHQGRFTVSVLCGMAAVLMYGPGFLGLADSCVGRTPRLARFAGWTAAVSMTAFFGVRAIQAVQLATVRQGLDHRTAAKVIDAVGANPLGITVLVLFLGGALVGTVSLAVATWRAGLPKVAAVMLGVFQLVDLALPGHLGTVLSHTLLLVALGWFATYLWADSSGETEDGAVVGQVDAGSRRVAR
jgi:hypothetical protein